MSLRIVHTIPAFVLALSGLTARPAHAAVDEAAPTLRAQILDVSLNGPYCEGALSQIDGYNMTVRFDQLVVGQQSANCTLTVDLEVPAGYDMGPPRVSLGGIGAGGTFQRRYAFEGGGSSATFSDPLVEEEDFVLVDRAPELYSPSCSATQRARFNIDLSATITSPEGYFQLYSLEMDTSWRFGVEYRRCGDTEPVTAPPGQVGDFCAGAQERICASGLGCELDLAPPPGAEGRCVALDEDVPPVGRNEKCGGLRDIECQTGLVCWRASEQAVTEGWLGRCLAPVAGEGDPCEHGVPALSCEADLFCFDSSDSSICVAADGSLGSRCGEGLPECNAGLFCNGAVCAVPRPN